MPPANNQTFGDHISELRKRLFYVLFVIVVFCTLGWIFNNSLFHILQKPLGQQLYYTSPIGGFNAVVKISMLVGLTAGIPILIYQLCQFVVPAFGREDPRRQSHLLFASLVLASCGIAFGYFVALPASLRFLTHINQENFQPLLVVNDYLNFVFSYLLGFALLFQLPLVISFINKRGGPIKPRVLMHFQKWVILISFILAAILTPTPDPVNQAMMALPIILLYQVSIAIVWLQNRKLAKVDAEEYAANESAAEEKLRLLAPLIARTAIAALSTTKPKPTFMDIIPPAKTSSSF